MQPRLVHSRYGLHIVEVLARKPGRRRLRAGARAHRACELAAALRATALHQYMQLLAGQALVEGVDLDGRDSPLVQ